MKRRWRLLLLTCFLAGSAWGCSRVNRISECRELIRTVNAGIDELEPISKGKETPESFEKMAKGYTTLANEVAALPAARGAASAQVMEYVQVLRSAASSSRETSVALREGSRTDKSRRELERLSRRDMISAQKLDAYCQAP